MIETLASHPTHSTTPAHLTHPTLLSPRDATDRATLDRLRHDAGVSIADTILDQLRELIRGRRVRQKLTDDALDEAVREHLSTVTPDDQGFANRGLDAYGRWVYYPWSSRLVHVLPEREFKEVRSNRNLYKITEDEQRMLATKCIGIVGLSVGFSAARTMAMEGIAGAYRLADPDTISLSNTNRVDAGVFSLGLNKAVHAARRLFEIDPYLKIEVFAQGVEREGIDRFLSVDGRNLDLLVEECDDLALKIRLRERARVLRIPVLMETNDRGMLDVERFDREPGREILHGLVGASSDELDGLDRKAQIPFVFRIVGGEAISPRAAASLVEINETLSSWPQLASGAELGGAVLTDTARRVLLDELRSSGRYFVNLHEIIADPSTLLQATAQHSNAQATTPHAAPATVSPATQRAASPAAPFQETPETMRVSRAVSDERAALVRAMVEYGIMAPSGGNNQPWRFVHRDDVLDCHIDVERAASFLDFEMGAAYAAIGAAVENMVIAAEWLGADATPIVFPDAHDSTLVCRVLLARRRPLLETEVSVSTSGSHPANRGPQPGDEDRRVHERSLFEAIQTRCTNRKLGRRVPLSDDAATHLVAAAESRGADLRLLRAPEELARVGRLLGEVDRLRFLSDTLHQEMMREVRWTREEVEATRDGLDVATLELGPVDLTGLKLMASRRVIGILRKAGVGAAVEQNSRYAVDAASAVGLIARNGLGPASSFEGGRAMERVWIEATRLGLAFQPISTAPYVFARLKRGAGVGFSESERRTLQELLARYEALFPSKEPRTEILLFRVSAAEQVTARSLRRPLTDVLQTSPA